MKYYDYTTSDVLHTSEEHTCMNEAVSIKSRILMKESLKFEIQIYYFIEVAFQCFILSGYDNVEMTD